MNLSLLVAISIFSAAGFAQEEAYEPAKPKSQWAIFTYDIGNVFGAVGHSYTRPLHWKGSQWGSFAMVFAGTGTSYLMDDVANDFFNDQGKGMPKILKDYGRSYGSPEINYLATSGVYLSGFLAKDEKLRRTGVLLLASATSTGLLQQVFKSVIGRARPVSGKSKDTFDPFNRDRNFHSFPSGHAMLAFSNAYAIGKQFKNPWIKGGIYTIGLIPGLSRLWEGQHWFSDVVLGVVISIFTVESIDKYLDTKYNEKYNQKKKKVQWNMTFAPNSLGISLNF